jgi:hypothetical protein
MELHTKIHPICLIFDQTMFFDWLAMYQDFEHQLPFIADRANVVIDTATGDHLYTTQPTHTHEGSFCTSLHVRVSGNRITVSGNPSRINRLDNLFGFFDLDDCVAVYNRVLLSLGLPPFSKCTGIYHRQGKDGKRVETFSDGAIITELHITTNRSVGQGCVVDYIKALSTQRYRNSIPRLHTNGHTCDWLTARGKASLIYPSVYNKAHELKLHSLPKYLKAFGAESREVADLNRVIKFCEENGVTRHELKLKSAFLRREGCRYYGLFNPAQLRVVLDEFLAIDDRLQVTAMELETISEKLLRLGVCASAKSANATALYAMQWMSGRRFDLSKSQVKVSRARLRKIGIDIAEVCDISKHSPVLIRKATEVVVSELAIPNWYQMPQRQPLRLVA